MKNKLLNNIIEALSIHQDAASIEVLERLGTNSLDEDVRTMTAKALVQKNTKESLEIAILREGKGINDLSTSVAMSTVNELLALDDKTEAMSILSNLDTELEKEIKETAEAVKALMTFSI